jgi:heptosyltransferase III
MYPLKNIPYWLDQKIRRVATWILCRLTTKAVGTELDVRSEPVAKILLVRANFRMGDLILATPAVSLFRKAFPSARIDFVAGPIATKLFRHLPIDRHFSITRRFPHSSWEYMVLLRKLRRVGYDLAIDLSCSQSGMGSFIVGFSGARYRVGLQGKWDRWFNVRIPRPAEKNKYRILPAFLRLLGLEAEEMFPSLVLSPDEKEAARKRIEHLIRPGGGPIVGVFIGGRKARGKRWPLKNFCRLITTLYSQGVNVVTFVGPEERNLIGVLSDVLDPVIPLVYEPSPKDFAAMVSNCDLFVTCDSGPMHLACALGTRTVAVFQNSNFDHWGPPASLARIVYQPGGRSVKEVLRNSLLELAALVPDFIPKGFPEFSPLVFIAKIRGAVRRFNLSVAMRRLYFFDSCAQALFLLALITYACFFHSSSTFGDGTWLDAFTDAFGMGSLIFGALLRVSAMSHSGKLGGSRFKAVRLITTGPYAYLRNPVEVGAFFIGVGLVFLLDAFLLIPLLVALTVWQHAAMIRAKEELLKEMIGEKEFEAYRSAVPKYVPTVVPGRDFYLGRYLPLSELGAGLGIILAGLFLDWMESPLNRQLVADVFRFVSG